MDQGDILCIKSTACLVLCNKMRCKEMQTCRQEDRHADELSEQGHPPTDLQDQVPLEDAKPCTEVDGETNELSDISYRHQLQASHFDRRCVSRHTGRQTDRQTV